MGYNEQTNPDWSPADVDFFNAMKAALLPLTYSQKEAFYNWAKDKLSAVSGSFEYRIVDNPDPDDPTEQPPGNTITDARLGGMASKLTYGRQTYTREDFDQTVDSVSMKGSTGVLFKAGRTVVIDRRAT